MKLEAITPEQARFGATRCILANRRRGMPKGQETRMGGAIAIQAEVPLSEMFGYVTNSVPLLQVAHLLPWGSAMYAPPPEAVSKAI